MGANFFGIPEISYDFRHRNLRCCHWRVGLEEHSQPPEGARATSGFSSTAKCCFNSSPWRWRTTSYQILDENADAAMKTITAMVVSPWYCMHKEGIYHWVIQRVWVFCVFPAAGHELTTCSMNVRDVWIKSGDNFGSTKSSPNLVFFFFGAVTCVHFYLAVEPSFWVFLWGLRFLLVHVGLCRFALVEGGFLFSMSNPPNLI